MASALAGLLGLAAVFTLLAGAAHAQQDPRDQAHGQRRRAERSRA